MCRSGRPRGCCVGMVPQLTKQHRWMRNSNVTLKTLTSNGYTLKTQFVAVQNLQFNALQFHYHEAQTLAVAVHKFQSKWDTVTCQSAGDGSSVTISAVTNHVINHSLCRYSIPYKWELSPSPAPLSAASAVFG